MKEHALHLKVSFIEWMKFYATVFSYLSLRIIPDFGLALFSKHFPTDNFWRQPYEQVASIKLPSNFLDFAIQFRYNIRSLSLGQADFVF